MKRATTCLTLTVDEDGLATITIDVPGRSMNVLTSELTRDLQTAVERIADDPDIKGALITSGKSSGFLAGADLKDFKEIIDHGITPQAAADISTETSRLFRRMETCGKPFAAAINGLALGGGLELCLACHYRVLSEHGASRLGLPEVKVGLLPGAGGTQRLPRLVGVASSLPLLLEGRSLEPSTALKAGLVHEVVEHESVREAARRWLLTEPSAEQPWDRKGFRVPGGADSSDPHVFQAFASAIARTTAESRGNYPAPLAILSCVYEGVRLGIEAGLRIESKRFGTLLSGPVARNMISTLFINKEAADKLANRPADPAKLKVQRLGIIGAGMMGTGIAQVAACAGMQAILIDVSQEQADAAKERIAAALAKEVRRGKRSDTDKDAILARITTTTQYDALQGAELVVEAVSEDRSIKASVTSQCEAVLPENAIMASNTSTLAISGLAKASCRPDQFIGLHFFSPVDKMPLVEMIVGKETSEATRARAMDFVAQLRKTPIVIKDSPGFFTSRVFMNFPHEGMKMLEEGVDPVLIENAARAAGFKVGPLEVADEVTLSLMQSILHHQDKDELPERYRLRTGRRVIDRMVDELDRPSRRAGAGFYDYPEGQEKRLWSGLAEAFPRSEKQPSVATLKQRFLYIMALETARCLEEGILMNPADADIGSILGIGYPAWTGGTLSFIEMEGLPDFVERSRELAERFHDRFLPSEWLVEQARAGGTHLAVP